jgi:creatinine amidohydrolase
VLPELPYGCSLGHSTKWPGTLSLTPATLAAVVAEIATWVRAAGFRQLLLLNGHVTNWAPLRSALEMIRHGQPELRIALRSLWDVSPRVHEWYCADAANFHANRAETAMMLALRPELVRMERAVDEPDRAAQCFFSYRMDQETVHGVVGQPTAATRELGRALIEACAADLAEQLGRALTERIPLDQYLPQSVGGN